MRKRFWERLPLAALTQQEWEALCDRCGKCCLLKLEDEETGRVHYTHVACRLFDAATRTCGNYELRRKLVSGCVVLTPETLSETAPWMPATCAYRVLHEGRKLADWHPLISGRAETVVEAGVAVSGPLIPEYEVAEEDLEDHLMEHDPTEDTG